MVEQELTQLYSDSFRYHQAGNLDAAAAGYARILLHRPKHVDCLHLLAVCRHAQGAYPEAQSLLGKALKLKPDLGTLHLSYGNVLREIGKLNDAIVSYRRAATLDPRLALALYNLGTAYEEANKPADALDAYRRSLDISASADAWGGYANCLAALGRLAEAESAYRSSLALNGAQPKVLANLGGVLRSLGRLEEAQALARQALALEADAGGADLRQRALILNDLGRYDQALAVIDEQLARGHGLTALERHQRARALWWLDRTAESLRELERCFAEAPGEWEIRSDLAAALSWIAERVPEALAHFALLEQQRPGNPVLAMNRAKALHTVGRHQEAVDEYSTLIDRAPEQQRLNDRDLGMVRFGRSMIDLLRGNFERGWRDYEFRWAEAQAAASPVAQRAPRWEGEKLAGGHLHLYPEQGLGDVLHFARFVPRAAALAGSVVLEVPWPLQRLLARNLGAGITVQSSAPPVAPGDRALPLLSLPGHFGVDPRNDLSPAPYLQADERCVQTWRNRLARRAVRRIGVVWSGNPSHRRDHERSVALKTLRPVLDTFRAAMDGEIEFLALQTHMRREDQDAWADIDGLHYFGNAIGDFEDTAALIALCDLVVCVDTAAAHLAGAMGKETWVLLQHVPDWRWMLDRCDTPWYPSLTLFRQPVLGDWDAVIASVCTQAARWCAGRDVP